MLMMYRSSQNGEAIEKVANATEENKDEVVKADETASEETVSDETSNEGQSFEQETNDLDEEDYDNLTLILKNATDISNQFKDEKNNYVFDN